MMRTTTQENIDFIRRRIAERRATADEFRRIALGNTVECAKECLENAKLSEAMATAQENALQILGFI